MPDTPPTEEVARAARTEAEKRYPADRWDVPGFDDARSVTAFVAGAQWGAALPHLPQHATPDRDEPAFERRAMSARTSLVEPSPLLRRVRQRFVDSGGAGRAFDWSVNEYARPALLSNGRDEVEDVRRETQEEVGA